MTNYIKPTNYQIKVKEIKDMTSSSSIKEFESSIKVIPMMKTPGLHEYTGEFFKTF